jgi:phosphatidylglycerophosphate synthase
MALRTKGLWLVESVSLFRLLAALLFASVAFQNLPLIIVVSVYGFAMASDLVDGFLARRLKMDTYFGKVLDLVSDKSLTIVSVLYAAARGIHLLPLGVIAIREVVSLGMRIVVVDGMPLLSTNRILGGFMSCLLWGTTLWLATTPTNGPVIGIIGTLYDVCAGAFALNLIVRVCGARGRIRASLREAPQSRTP